MRKLLESWLPRTAADQKDKVSRKRTLQWKDSMAMWTDPDYQQFTGSFSRVSPELTSSAAFQTLWTSAALAKAYNYMYVFFMEGL